MKRALIAQPSQKLSPSLTMPEFQTEPPPPSITIKGPWIYACLTDPVMMMKAGWLEGPPSRLVNVMNVENIEKICVRR